MCRGLRQGETKGTDRDIGTAPIRVPLFLPERNEVYRSVGADYRGVCPVICVREKGRVRIGRYRLRRCVCRDSHQGEA
jgi:hypothetical protein